LKIPAQLRLFGNTAASNISVLNACKAAGVECNPRQRLGRDEMPPSPVRLPMALVFRCAPRLPGAERTRHENHVDISKISDAAGTVYRPVTTSRASATALYMKEAVEWAARTAARTGENVKKGFYRKPTGYRPEWRVSAMRRLDREGSPGTLKVDLYRMKVAGATDAPLNDLVRMAASSSRKLRPSICRARPMAWLVRYFRCCHPAKAGSSTPRLVDSVAEHGILDHPPEPVIGGRSADPWRVMTAASELITTSY